MTEGNLSQAEADALIGMEKHRVDQRRHSFPGGGESLIIPLQSPDRREAFLLDISRGRIDLSKVTYQCRARQIAVLVRIDLAGRPHRNPDDEEIPCPHMHVYREGCGDKWALPIPAQHFADTTDMWRILKDFYGYCNITMPPHIDRGLWS